MTSTRRGHSTMLEEVKELAPEIARRAGEIDEARAVPADLVGKLRAAGAFRALLPRRVGGAELTILEFVRVLEEVSRADGSTGWTVMIGADFPIALSRFPADVLAELYADGPDMLARGAFAPKGMAVRGDGGYLVSGRWPLASGSYDHQWVVGNCVVLEDGAPVMLPEGIPDMRACLFRPDQVEFLDTWHSMGLRATASNDFTVSELFVPERYATAMFGPATWGEPLYRLPLRIALGPTHAGVVLGIAQGAVDDLAALSRSKRPAFNPLLRLAEDPVFRHRLGELALRLDALRSFAYDIVEELWAAAEAGIELSPVDALRARSMVAYVHVQCVDIVNECFSLAGSDALYDTSTLQRRWRDVRAAAQHAGASPETYQILGGLLAGEQFPPFLVY